MPPPLASLLALLTFAAAVTEAPPEWRTRAETSDFAATSTYEETVVFLGRLAVAAPGRVRVESFGTSAQGREMPLVIVSGDGAFTPAAARATGKPIVLIQSGIHAGEIDGKDATLLLLRDFVLRRGPDLARAGTLLFLPIYNVDGHERVSPWNRPNQDGPRDGMGFRTTASGLDLNRDHLKLASVEAQALVALVNAWRPHLHVDNHVTDGAELGWVLTYAYAQAPQIEAGLADWLAEHVEAAVKATAALGHLSGPFLGFLDETDPRQGLAGWAVEPRYATGYFPLRNRPSLLVEMHSYSPYRERVLANRDFLLALLAEVAADPPALVRAVAAAEARTVALGGPQAPPSQVALAYRAGDERVPVRMPLADWSTATSQVTGQPLLRYRPGARLELDLVRQVGVEVTAAVPRPRGYLVLPGWTAIESRLRGHGLRVERLTAPVELEVETLRVADPEYAATSYQGLHRVEATVSRQREWRAIPAGALWVPAAQPDFEVAVQLLEPEAPDSLLSWGLLSSVFERKEYIEPRVLETIAERMLAEDPALRAQWQTALADPDFAKDAAARHLWWYRRTPYWDETVGLLPYFRVLVPPSLQTRP